MSWYRQYRPNTIAGLHLDSVRQSLQAMLQSGKVPHALLFAGPRGTGKTSAARILAAIVNDPANAAIIDAVFFQAKAPKSLELHEPNLDDELVQRIYRGSTFMIHELDAASNRGIDHVRELKEQINLPPQEGKISVYILDEVHMLTTEAFNALLKVLEEPPPHALFILATTELNKIPETVRSRCVTVQFHQASAKELVAALQQILEAESIKFEVAALERIAELADGSFRDAVKLLEQAAGDGTKLSLEKVSAALGQDQRQDVHRLLEAVIQKNPEAVVQFFAEVRLRGVSPSAFLSALLHTLHTELVSSIQPAAQPQYAPKIAHYLLTQFSSLPTETSSVIPFLQLELKSLEMVFKAQSQAAPAGTPSSPTPAAPSRSTPTPKSTPKAVASAPVQTSTSVTELDTQFSPNQISDVIANVVPVTGIHGSILIEKWEEFLHLVRDRNSSVAALLRSSKPIAGAPGKAEIEVYYQFHRDQLSQPKFLSMLEECVVSILGERVIFEFTLAELPTARPIDVTPQASSSSDRISSPINSPKPAEPGDQLLQLAKEILV